MSGTASRQAAEPESCRRSLSSACHCFKQCGRQLTLRAPSHIRPPLGARPPAFRIPQSAIRISSVTDYTGEDTLTWRASEVGTTQEYYDEAVITITVTE